VPTIKMQLYYDQLEAGNNQLEHTSTSWYWNNGCIDYSVTV